MLNLFFASILGVDPPSYRSLFEIATNNNSRSPIYQETPPSFWERQGCLCEKNKCEYFSQFMNPTFFSFKTDTLKTYKVYCNDPLLPFFTGIKNLKSALLFVTGLVYTLQGEIVFSQNLINVFIKKISL